MSFNMQNPDYYENCAKKLFLQGYNCSQSVVGAFADLMNMERSQVIRMASAFGGGMGRMREVCGCVSGMLIVLGYLYGYDDPSVYDGKKELYGRVQELADVFRRDNGSIICRELLGNKGVNSSHIPEKRTEEYYKKRPCPSLAGYAARILAEYIQKHPV